MEIKSLLSPDDAVVGIRAADKTRLLQELAGRAAVALGLAAELVSTEVLKREELGSTGIGKGVAIPHARVPGVKKPYGILAQLRKAIDFDAIDEQPVDLVFLLLLPAGAGNDPLNALACVARKLRQPEALRELRLASDGASLYRAATAEPKPV